MNLRPLSKELQAKATAELNEVPERMAEDVEYMKVWLRKQVHLNARLDDQLIVTYLRGCKYSLEKTKSKFESLYTLKAMLPEFFSNRDPFDEGIQSLLKIGAILPLNKTATPDSPRVLMFRGGITDPSEHKIETLFKLNMMIGEIIVREDDQFVIGGLVLFQDMSGMGIGHMIQMNPLIAKKSMTFFQEAYPIRPKQMHFFNIPSFFDTMMGIIKPFMKDKMQRRLHVHNTSRIEEMYEYIPKSILPTEYGGDAGPLQDQIDYWKKKVESYADYFKNDYVHVADESKRVGKSKIPSDIFGVEGSFRKLNVD